MGGYRQRMNPDLTLEPGMAEIWFEPIRQIGAVSTQVTLAWRPSCHTRTAKRLASASYAA